MRLKLDSGLTATSALVVVAALSLAVTAVGVAASLRIKADIRRLGQQLHDEDPSVSLGAVEELRERGWLADGRMAGGYKEYWNMRATNLQGADLSGANLSGAIFGARRNRVGTILVPAANLKGADLSGTKLQEVDLSEVDLSGATLAGADLRGAVLLEANLLGARGLTDARLVHVSRMRGARMPDGTRYDGRYRLRGDHDWARKKGIGTDDPVAMAAFYEVTPEEFLAGQEWAEENLKELRREGRAGAGEGFGGVEPGGVAVLAAVLFSASAAILLARALPGPDHAREVL